MRVSVRAFCVWALTSIMVAGVQVSLFDPAFRETWYAPLHFLWVVASACAVSLYLCLGTTGPGERRWRSVLRATALLAVCCVVSWIATRVSWGVAIVGEARLPLAGIVAIIASLLLLLALFVLGSACAVSHSEKTVRLEKE